MHFNTSVHELDRHIGATLSALATSIELYEKEGINDAALREIFAKTSVELDALRDSIREILAAYEGRYEMIRYLNLALQMEYENILDYERYVNAVEDERLAGRIRAFCEEEWQHARALAAKISDLGGKPHFTVIHGQKPDMTVFELLRQHHKTEQDIIRYYETGLERFDDAAFRWLVGRIKVEEEEHRLTLEALLDEYRDTAILVQESKAFRWVDPYMGKPGDRAWIE